LDEVRQIRREAIPRLAVRNHEPAWNRDWSEALECQSAVPVIEAALLSAVARASSLGAHRRHDDPGGPSGALKHNLVRLDGDTLLHHEEPVTFPLLSP
jgi:succinate dehydrogenase/fumarate reductase flavoprotein subunit